MVCAFFTPFSLLSPKGCPTLYTNVTDLWAYVVVFMSTVHSSGKPLRKVRNISDYFYRYHWAVLFVLINCALCVRFNEHCSLALEAETVHTSIWPWGTLVLTQQLQLWPSCYHMLCLCIVCANSVNYTVEQMMCGPLSMCSSTLDQIWWWGAHTNSCRVSWILVHTNRLQNGLASNVMAASSMARI
jgi:hypothetical protein